ncbi:tripartite tricarboxylate transporter TctB family protein [Halanaerobium sp. MA284_MarDTE_T2]|uniref:tripartite tricarboxylate transporter TctB family protein n=1 Tax=Halanaerobium sp. MA284_MarDTE_T2 TaxID=2183913 RepID=UPI000DF206D3|nr:tripartite tricarboxylate transporter TctB family protein [Halanaerobium sp. MA284_MarDTE_T2]RCW48646.1 tripartite tricarboxylate transporter TctB family protein [Halanaerobium sp. MA284_MarDTE_T2]
MRTFKKEIIIALIIFFISIFLLFYVNTFDVNQSKGVGPAFWPRIIISFMLVLSLINLGSLFKKRDKIMEETEAYKEEKDIEEIKNNSKKFFISLIILSIYSMFLRTLGFILLTPLLLVSMFWNLGYRKKILAPVIAIVIVVLLAYIFPNYLNLLLPRGQSIFRKVSYIFY